MTDEEDHGAPFKYVVAVIGKLHHVFLVRKESPEWWRLVATFADAERARDYADIEQTFSDDTFVGERIREPDLRDHRSDEGAPPADLPALPRSSLIPGEIVRRSTVVEHTRIERHEDELHPTPEMLDDLNAVLARAKALFEEMGYQRGLAAALANSPVGSPEAPPAELTAELVPAADNNGRTPLVQAVTPQGSEFTDAPVPSDPVVQPESEPCQPALPSGKPVIVPDAVNTGPSALLTHDDGMAAEDGERPGDEGHISEEAATVETSPGEGTGGAAASVLISSPSEVVEKINTPGDYHVELVDAAGLRPLSKQEWAVVSALVTLLRGTAKRLKLADIAAKSEVPHGSLPAILFSLQTKGYAKNIGVIGNPHWLISFYGVPKISEGRWPTKNKAKSAPQQHIETAQPVAHPQQEIIPENMPDEAKDDHDVTVNDLSRRAQQVLKALCKTGYTNSKALAREAHVDDSRILYLLERLQHFICIDGNFAPTDRGRAFAEQIPDFVGTAPGMKPISPAPETKVSYPVVRREPSPAPSPAKPNGNAAVLIDKRLDIVEYLEKKGRTVSRIAVGLFVIDGERRRLSDILPIVNAFRARQDLPPLEPGDVR